MLKSGAERFLSTAPLPFSVTSFEAELMVTDVQPEQSISSTRISTVDAVTAVAAAFRAAASVLYSVVVPPFTIFATGGRTATA